MNFKEKKKGFCCGFEAEIAIEAKKPRFGVYAKSGAVCYCTAFSWTAAGAETRGSSCTQVRRLRDTS